MICQRIDSISQDTKFYGIMGRYFANRSIVKELGSQLYNEPNSVWYLLYDGGELIGFCSVFIRKSYKLLDNVYIFSNKRNLGYAQYLIGEVLNDVAGVIKLISCNPVSNHIYEKFGFKCCSQNGKWKRYILEVS